MRNYMRNNIRNYYSMRNQYDLINKGIHDEFQVKFEEVP